MGSSSQGQSRRGQSSSGRDLSPISPLKGSVLARVGVVQLRLLPAPAQMGKKPGSATSQPEKIQRDTQLVRWDGLFVTCPTDVAAAPLGSKNLRQFQETAMDLESGVRSQSLLNDFDLTCQVSASSFVK